MENLELHFVELHNPLFLPGKNLGTKLNSGKTSGLKLSYSREFQELYVQWGKYIGIVPASNVSCMLEGKPEKEPPQHTHPMLAGIGSAQVETPFGHVHAGPGKGKTGSSK